MQGDKPPTDRSGRVKRPVVRISKGAAQKSPEARFDTKTAMAAMRKEDSAIDAIANCPLPHTRGKFTHIRDVCENLPIRNENGQKIHKGSSPEARPPAEPQKEDELSEADLAEARRIANELVKLHKAGAIKDADDFEAVFSAHFIRSFGATFIGNHLYPDYPDMLRRMTWDAAAANWV
jgi:hypothetical protein